MSLVNQPSLPSLGRPRKDPRATGGGDAQTVHSAARRVSGQPCAGGSTKTHSTDCPDARPGCADCDHGSNGAGAIITASFLLPDNPGKPPANFSYRFAGAYERDQGLNDLKSLSPMHEVKTLILTQSLLPLAQLWGGRLRLDGFTSTLHMQLGPSAGGGLQDFRSSRQNYFGGPRSVDLYGFSLSFHFGRDAQVGRPAQIWSCLARIASRRKSCSEG